MRITQNIPALQTYNALNATNTSLSKSIGRLSTGLRINSAADDAAGLAISQKMRAQMNGLDQAANNAQDGISIVQTAEGALSETHSILQRMRELSVQAANDTMTAEDRSYIQLEVGQLREEIDRIATTTQFNKKKLLDGSSSALWSSDRLSTEVMIRGGLARKDRFGQKVVAEGNYKIDITATPGEAEIQKSNLFLMRTETTGHWYYSTDPLKVDLRETRVVNDSISVAAQNGSCSHITVAGFNGALATGGSYTFAFPDQLTEGKARIASTYNMDESDILLNPTFPPGTLNANILFEAVAIHDEQKSVTFRAYSRRFDSMGVAQPDIETFITISADGITGGQMGDGIVQALPDGSYEVNDFDALGIVMGQDAIRLNKPFSEFSVGTKFLYNVAAPETPGTPGVPITLTNNGTGDYILYNMSQRLTGVHSNVPIPFMELNEATGAVSVCDVVVNLTNLGNQSFPHPFIWNFTVGGASSTETIVTPLDTMIEMVEYLPPERIENTLDKDPAFITNSGASILKDPQTLTLHMNGKSTNVTLYGTDTFSDMVTKINDAISRGLGQGIFVDNLGKFATIADGTGGTSESVYRRDPIYNDPGYIRNTDGSLFLDANGEAVVVPRQIVGYNTYATMLIRTAITGEAGKIKFSGSEDLLKALGLSTIQESRESEFTVTVYDAHSGELVEPAQEVTGNTIYGLFGGSVDVEFDPLAGADVTWSEDAKRFIFKRDEAVYSTTVHLADNTTTLQIGANEGEDFSMSFDDMSASALGLDGLLVISRETAARSLTTIDGAINKVSTARARLGAYQNRLEHTITNLTTTGTNMTASESRIRDTDMAKEMMTFTKLNILSQAGNSMLGQANQLPQAMLTLLR